MSISYIHCQFLWPHVIPAKLVPYLIRERESRRGVPGDWMPAYAGMTLYWCWTYETDI